jgi:hypothetical protein
MTIEDSKEANLRPLYSLRKCLSLRLHDIQNDTHSIFVVVSDNTLVGIGRVRLHDSTGLGRSSCYFMILEKHSPRIEYVGALSK